MANSTKAPVCFTRGDVLPLGNAWPVVLEDTGETARGQLMAWVRNVGRSDVAGNLRAMTIGELLDYTLIGGARVIECPTCGAPLETFDNPNTGETVTSLCLNYCEAKS